MKKIIISISAAFIFIFNCLIPFNVYAVEDSHYYTYDQFKSIYNIDYDSFDIMFKYQFYNDFWHYNYYHTCGLSIRKSEYNSTVSQCTYENGIFTVVFNSAQDFKVSQRCDESVYNVSSSPNTYKVKRFIYDSTNNTISMYNNNNELITYECIGNGECDFDITDFNSNFDILSDEYNINVSFSPVLNGNVDRKDNNGNTLESFRMIVDNYSRFDVQILMTIVKHGSTIGFYNPSLGGTLSLQRVIVSGNPIFTWWKDTPNYTFDSTITEEQNFAHAHHPDVSTFYEVEKQYGPCPWHMVGASNGHLVQDFDWSQINLEDHGNYDVLVYAVRNDHGIPSRQALSNNYDYYVDYSDIQLVYSSNFTLTNPYIYDSNNKNHGNYALMNDVLLSSTSKEYIDSNGEVHQGKELNDLLNKQKEREGQWYSDYSSNIYSDTEYYSSSSVPSSFKSSYNSFISFVTHVFNGFPGDIKTIYFYSFLGICVLGIIKRVT